VVTSIGVAVDAVLFPLYVCAAIVECMALVTVGISAATRARKPGVVAAPFVGPAKTMLAFWFCRLTVNDPEVVIGEPETGKYRRCGWRIGKSNRCYGSCQISIVIKYPRVGTSAGVFQKASCCTQCRQCATPFSPFTVAEIEVAPDPDKSLDRVIV
jgi:hypothetical protein